jgi:CheY-like chemotaxis protein
MILFVEDDAKDRHLIQSVLSRWEYKEQVTFVSTSVLAKTCLKKSIQLPAVVVIDLKLPEIDGFELVAQIRNEYANLPIVVFSSSMRPADIARCYKNGASAYVIKHISFERFGKAVKGIVDFWVHLNQT